MKLRRGAQDGPGERPAGRRGGCRNTFSTAFMISADPALWLIDSELGGAHGWSGIGLKLCTSIFVAFCNDFYVLADVDLGREGPRGAQDGPGERPAGRRGGCRITFSLWFYSGFTISKHPARRVGS